VLVRRAREIYVAIMQRRSSVAVIVNKRTAGLGKSMHIEH